MGSGTFSTSAKASAIATASFRHLDSGGAGRVGGAAVVQFLLKSGLEKSMLRHIWTLCATTHPTSMDFEQYSKALRLIAHQQTQRPVTIEALHAPHNASVELCPTFVGVPFIDEIVQRHDEPVASAATPATQGEDSGWGDFSAAGNEATQPLAAPTTSKASALPVGLGSDPFPVPANVATASHPAESQAAAALPSAAIDTPTPSSIANTDSRARKYIDASLFSLTTPSKESTSAAASTSKSGGDDWGDFGGFADESASAVGKSGRTVSAADQDRSATIMSAFDDIDNVDDAVLIATDPRIQALSEKLGRLFDEVDTKDREYLTGAQTVQFFTKTGVHRDILRRVWSLADSGQKSYLSKSDFVIAARLVALAQTGHTIDWNSPDAKLLALLEDCEPFDLTVYPEAYLQVESGGVNAVVGDSDAQTAVLERPRVSDYEKDYLTRAWASALGDAEDSGLLDGKLAVPFFLQSGVDRAVMRNIWSFAVAPKPESGMAMNFDEFCIAVRCVAAAKEGRELQTYTHHPLLLPSLPGVPGATPPPQRPMPTAPKKRQSGTDAGSPSQGPLAMAPALGTPLGIGTAAQSPGLNTQDAAPPALHSDFGPEAGNDGDDGDDDWGDDFGDFSSGGVNATGSQPAASSASASASASNPDVFGAAFSTAEATNVAAKPFPRPITLDGFGAPAPAPAPAPAHDRSIPLDELMSQYYSEGPATSSGDVTAHEEFGQFGSAATDGIAGVGGDEDADEWGEFDAGGPGEVDLPDTNVISQPAFGATAGADDEWADFDDGGAQGTEIDAEDFDHEQTLPGGDNGVADSAAGSGVSVEENVDDPFAGIETAVESQTVAAPNGPRSTSHSDPSAGQAAENKAVASGGVDDSSSQLANSGLTDDDPFAGVTGVQFDDSMLPPPSPALEGRESRAGSTGVGLLSLDAKRPLPPWPQDGASDVDFVRALVSRERFDEAMSLLQQAKLNEGIARLKSEVAAAAVEERFEDAIALRKERDVLLAQGATEDDQEAWRRENVSSSPTSSLSMDEMVRELVSSGHFVEAVQSFNAAFGGKVMAVYDAEQVPTIEAVAGLSQLKSQATRSFQLLEKLMTTHQMHAEYFDWIECSVAEELHNLEAVVTELQQQDASMAAELEQKFFNSDEVRKFRVAIGRAMLCVGRVSKAKELAYIGEGGLQSLTESCKINVVRSIVADLVSAAEQELEAEEQNDRNTDTGGGCCEICLLSQGPLTEVSHDKKVHVECGAWWLNRMQGSLPSN